MRLALRAAVLVAAGVVLAGGAGAQVVKRNVATLPFQAGLLAIDARNDAHVVIGAAAGDRSLAVVIRQADARQWADSIGRLLAFRPRASRAERVYRATVTDSASGAGVTFSRHVTRRASTYRVFFANARYSGFRVDLEPREARLFLEKMRAALRLTRTLSRAARSPDGVRAPPR